MNLFGALDVAQLTSLGERGVRALEDTARALERIAEVLGNGDLHVFLKNR